MDHGLVNMIYSQREFGDDVHYNSHKPGEISYTERNNHHWRHAFWLDRSKNDWMGDTFYVSIDNAPPIKLEHGEYVYFLHYWGDEIVAFCGFNDMNNYHTQEDNPKVCPNCGFPLTHEAE